MIIPESIANFTQFYIQAQKQNIQIKSRYKGVYVVSYKLQKRLEWKAKSCLNGKQINIGTFPFDKQGEIAAHRAYERFCVENNVN
jgi:hypothetical protein